MPKVTYPRPCPTCGKEIKHGSSFFNHTKQCSGQRYHCQHCPLTFSYHSNLQRHVQQQHSKTPLQFTCPECSKGFTSKQKLTIHLDTVCAEVPSSYQCWFCSARFTRHDSRQRHMRRVHGRVCQDHDINLLLHLQHLSEEPDCQNEWMFVESRPIEADEPHICPCGQPNIKSYFFLENKFNGNRTFVGSICIEHLDPRVGKVVGYFQHLLCKPIQGSYVGDLYGQQTFTVPSTTVLVRGADTIVHHLNPKVFKTLDGQWHVLVKYPKPETLIHGQSYALRLKAKYVHGQLTFTVV